MKIKVIVAICKNSGIGNKNQLPWPRFKTDMKFFSLITTGKKNNAILMGANTFRSLNNKPLPNRMNIVLSKSIENNNQYKNLKITHSIDEAIEFCIKKKYDELWVIGGNKLYQSIFDNEEIDISEFYVTYINNNYDCDCFFPKIKNRFFKKTIISKANENNVDLHFTRYYN